MQSVAKETGTVLPSSVASSSLKRAATGFSEYLGFTLPLGRPRCEARITFAPFESTYFSVGSVATMRVSSVIVEPSSVSGTLKSTRMNSFLLVRSMSRIESFAMGMRLP